MIVAPPRQSGSHLRREPEIGLGGGMGSVRGVPPTNVLYDADETKSGEQRPLQQPA